MTLRELGRWLLPPIVAAAARRVVSRRAGPAAGDRPVEWQVVPEGWDYARRHPEVKGWNVESVLEVYRGKWARFKSLVEGVGPLGISHESDLSTNTDVRLHNSVMSFGYALALAARNRDSLSVLDWGGGIGHYYLLARALLPEVEIEYHCKDVPLLAEEGARLLPQQHFHADDACLSRSYDFVLASTSLHYSEDWKATFASLAAATQGCFYVAHLPCVMQAPSFVFVQRPYRYGYDTEYLGWCLNRDEFLGRAEAAGLALVREFVYGLEFTISGAPEPCSYRGYLFRPGRPLARAAGEDGRACPDGLSGA